MGEKNSQLLDRTSGFATDRVQPFAALQALQVVVNVFMAYVEMPALLAQLDADVLTDSNYAATQTPARPADVRTKFNALLAKLDADTIVGDTNYAALLTAAKDEDLGPKWNALLAKLDADSGVPLTTYAANFALPFVTPLDAQAPAY